jgi:hypothetical protein
VRSAHTIRPRLPFLPPHKTDTQVEVKLNEQRQVTEGYPPQHTIIDAETQPLQKTKRQEQARLEMVVVIPHGEGPIH